MGSTFQELCNEFVKREENPFRTLKGSIKIQYTEIVGTGLPMI